MRKYSIVAFVSVSISCLSACGGPSSDLVSGAGDTAGMAGALDGMSGAGGTSAGRGGAANAAGGATIGDAGGTGEAGVTGATGGTTSALGGAAGASTGGTAGASAAGASATGGVAGSVAASGAAGSVAAGGTASGGVAGTAGAASGGTSGGGTAGGGTAGGGTAGADSAGTGGGGAGATPNGGTGGTGGTAGTAGAGGIGIGPNTACADADEGNQLNLVCPGSSIVTEILYASYGTPTGSCGSYTTSDCNSETSGEHVEAACLGKNNCTVNATNGVFDDPCVGTYKHLSVQATCSNCGNGVLDPGEVCDDGVTDGVLCSADCSTEPEVAQILVDCGPGTTEINSLTGTSCIVVNPGGASYISFSSPDVQVTLYSNADCTGESKVVSTELNFCDDSFDTGGGDGLNDNVRSVQVSRKPLPPPAPVDN